MLVVVVVVVVVLLLLPLSDIVLEFSTVTFRLILDILQDQEINSASHLLESSRWSQHL